MRTIDLRPSEVVIGIVFFVLLAGGPYLFFFNQFWTHLDLSRAAHVREYRSANIRGHRGRQILMHQDFFETAQRLDAYARKSGVKLLVVHSYRRPAAVLKDAKVRPGQRSDHLAGHALDINIRRGLRLYMFDDLKKDALAGLPSAVQDFIRQVRENDLLRWGGDFNDEDPVHIDEGLNIRDDQCWQLHYDQCLADVMAAQPQWKTRWRRLVRRLTGP